MTQLLALLAVLSLALLNSLGNFWFTFGIWPKSWVSFFLFTISSVIIFELLDMVRRDK